LVDFNIWLVIGNKATQQKFFDFIILFNFTTFDDFVLFGIFFIISLGHQIETLEKILVVLKIVKLIKTGMKLCFSGVFLVFQKVEFQKADGMRIMNRVVRDY